MSDSKLGQIGWCDLTVPDAKAVADFYRVVVGWEPSGLSMGDYEDFVMLAPGGEGAAGICHARGENAGLPAQWLVYINVADVDAAVQRCQEAGGALLHGPREVGGGRFAVIRDPAGAVAGLWQAPAA
jgi:predicted enzyme related to lactoylglutathione lyase